MKLTLERKKNITNEVFLEGGEFISLEADRGEEKGKVAGRLRGDRFRRAH